MHCTLVVIMASQPQLPYMLEHATRLDTFRFWPHERVSKFVLAANGFFFKGSKDLVQCFHCGVRLTAWKDSDIVQVEHIMNSPKCEAAKRKLLDISYATETITALINKLSELKDDFKTMEIKIEALSRIAKYRTTHDVCGNHRFPTDANILPMSEDVCDGPDHDLLGL